MQLLLHLRVLLDLLRQLEQFVLEFLAGTLTVPDHLLILSYVLLQVIEHLKFLIEGNQCVQFVLKLDLLFLQCQLKRILVSLVKHLSCESASSGHLGHFRCCGRAVIGAIRRVILQSSGRRLRLLLARMEAACGALATKR